MRRRYALGIVAIAGAAALAVNPAAAGAADDSVAAPSYFTSAYTAMATPDMVVNADSVPTPGTAGASGVFNYRLNSDLDIICYDITVKGITLPYMSPARTATHIHEGGVAKAGPPRLAFQNPEAKGDGTFVSSGCMQGPFTTGVKAADGSDTGTGFTLARIEANPSAFFTDTHTAASPAGAVRGQLIQVPVGGPETGGGGTAADNGIPLAPVALGLTALVGAGIVARRLATR